MVQAHVPHFVAKDAQETALKSSWRIDEAEQRPTKKLGGLQLVVPKCVVQACAHFGSFQCSLLEGTRSPGGDSELGGTRGTDIQWLRPGREATRDLSGCTFVREAWTLQVMEREILR